MYVKCSCCGKIKDVKEIKPFKIDKSNYGNMDDWLLIEKIDNVKI